MKISEETINALKNFATINQSLLFKKGQTQNTISVAKNIFASVRLEDKFPMEFGIYDLNEFLNALSLFEDPSIDFEESYMVISEKGASLIYNYADPSIIVSPPKEKLKMPDADVSFTITKDVFDKIIKSSSVLQLPDVCITREKDNLMIGVTDKSSDSSNGYALPIGKYDGDADFTFHIRAEILKILPDDYDVEISSKLISHWEGKNNNAEYFIALEKSSTFNG